MSPPDLPMQRGAKARRTARLVVAGLAVLALLPPLLLGATGAWREQDRVAAIAESIAWLLDDAALAHQGERRALERPPFPRHTEQRALLDASGRSTLVSGAPHAGDWPSVGARRVLRSGATLEVRHSLRELLGGVAALAAASAAFAAGFWMLAFGGSARALRQSERQLRALALCDTLTGLPNREGLRLALERALARRRGGTQAVGVLVIDLDRFRLVNASLGQAAGDELLRSVAARIRTVVPEGDLLARIGANQFAVLVEGVWDTQLLDVVARNLMRAFEGAHALHGRDTVVTASIGTAHSGEHADDVDRLLKCAELAMRAAKLVGGARWRRYEAAMRANDERRLELEQRLRAAARDRRFKLAFQPIVHADGVRVVGVEALLRWADSVHGPVSPAEFIPVLEETGLIVDVGVWLLRESCRGALDWIAGGAKSLWLSVNVSPRQFAEGDFVDMVATILAETGFPPRRLQLEVTEGLLLEPTPETLRKIDRLAAMGVRLALDDFGMGYSSLAYLKTFPLHGLKIDQIFVRDVTLLGRDAAIVRAIIELGHGLGLSVTAEGVESVEQAQALQRLGCDALQGYWFSPAVSARELQALLALPGCIDDEVDAAVTNWSQTIAGLLHPA